MDIVWNWMSLASIANVSQCGTASSLWCLHENTAPGEAKALLSSVHWLWQWCLAHTHRGPLLGYSKLKVMTLGHVLETFSSLRFKHFLSQSFAVPVYQFCCQWSEVSTGQPTILRWEHSWKAELFMYFSHASLSYHYWICKTVGEPYHTEFHITYKSSNLNL